MIPIFLLMSYARTCSNYTDFIHRGWPKICVYVLTLLRHVFAILHIKIPVYYVSCYLFVWWVWAFDFAILLRTFRFEFSSEFGIFTSLLFRSKSCSSCRHYQSRSVWSWCFSAGFSFLSWFVSPISIYDTMDTWTSIDYCSLNIQTYMSFIIDWKRIQQFYFYKHVKSRHF